MNSFLKSLVIGIVSFVGTNIDDIFVLTLFFSQARVDRWRVIAGQYLGFLALVAISLIGYFARLIIPPAWIGLLGLVPIALGVRAFIKRDEFGTRQIKSSSGVLSVAAVTFANGGDNIGIYMPLFASSDQIQ